MSLAMNKSIITFQGLFAGICPLKIITYLASIQNTVAIDFGTLLLQGITISIKSSGASVLQRAIVGIFT